MGNESSQNSHSRTTYIQLNKMLHNAKSNLHRNDSRYKLIIRALMNGPGWQSFLQDTETDVFHVNFPRFKLYITLHLNYVIQATSNS